MTINIIFFEIDQKNFFVSELISNKRVTLTKNMKYIFLLWIDWFIFNQFRKRLYESVKYFKHWNTQIIYILFFKCINITWTLIWNTFVKLFCYIKACMVEWHISFLKYYQLHWYWVIDTFFISIKFIYFSWFDYTFNFWVIYKMS